jgi:hypothetical protein
MIGSLMSRTFRLAVSLLLVTFQVLFCMPEKIQSEDHVGHVTRDSQIGQLPTREIHAEKLNALATTRQEEYFELRQAAKDVYVWAWPMVYLSNVQKSLQVVRTPGVSGGAPVAPINSLCMLTEVPDATFKSVPCPNPDFAYGFGMMDLENNAVVIQVPDFSNEQFWHYQVGDHRTDSFAELGSMYQTRPGFYLIVGPNWNDEVPEGIERVFRSPTNLAYILPRVVITPETRNDERLKLNLSQIAMYPSAKYSGRLKYCDVSKRKWYPSIGDLSREHCKRVHPASFFEDLRVVLNSVPPIPGEEKLYASAHRILEQADEDPKYAIALSRVATDLEQSEIVPLFHFRNVGDQLPGHWTSISNGAAFGNDYRTRTAVAKSNIFVNRKNEAKYFYLEHSNDGLPLSGDSEYEITFAANALPPHHAFWSLTLYDEDHHLFANPWGIHSIGSIGNTPLQWNADGSLTISVRPQQKTSSLGNWLPSPSGRFVLYLRIYVPDETAINGEWSPPAVTKKDEQWDHPPNYIAGR